MFQTIFSTPLFNGLIFLYNTIAFQDFGLAIIFLTLLIRVILFPIFYKSAENQILIQRLQPELNKIQHDHKDNREKQAQAMMDLYRKHKVNPFSGFLLLLVQLPILIALYQVFLKEFSPDSFNNLYDFIQKPVNFNTGFLGLLDLEKPSILMVSLAVVAQYFQGYLVLPKKRSGKEESAPERMARQMVYFGPLMTIIIFVNLPAAIGLYWLVTSAFSITQQIYINKTVNVEEEKKEHQF